MFLFVFILKDIEVKAIKINSDNRDKYKRVSIIVYANLFLLYLNFIILFYLNMIARNDSAAFFIAYG